MEALVKSSKRSPTMRDVANHAQVSVSTVSLVISGRKKGKSRISSETKARVRKAIKDLNYVPSQVARQLRKQSTERICIVLPQLRPYDNMLIRQLQQKASEQGYSVIVNISENELETSRILEQVRAGLADALLLYLDHNNAANLSIDKQLKSIAEAGIAAIIISDFYNSDSHDVIRTTVQEASTQACTYLIEKGYRRIGFIGHVLNANNYPRYQAYLDTLKAHGLDLNSALQTAGANSYQEGFEAMQSLLKHEPDAVLCASDIAAIGALAALHKAKLTAPKDIALMGMGNIPAGNVSIPQLSTIGPESLNFEIVASLLLKRLENPKEPPLRLEQPWKLILRESA